VGLVPGHAYSVLAVKVVYVLGCLPISLVKVRNPWGKTEYKGMWSDKSLMWMLCPTVKKECGVAEAADDGAFWMSLSAFVTYFDRVDVLHFYQNWTQRRLACRLTGQQSRLLLRLDEACELRVAVLQQRKDTSSRYPWKMCLVSTADRDKPLAGQTGTGYSIDCSLCTEEIKLPRGDYQVVVDGMDRRILPVDIVAVAYASKPCIRWMSNSDSQV